MTLHEAISARFVEGDAKSLLLELATHIDTLERKVEQLERFLPHHFKAPGIFKDDEIDDAGRL